MSCCQISKPSTNGFLLCVAVGFICCRTLLLRATSSWLTCLRPSPCMPQTHTPVQRTTSTQQRSQTQVCIWYSSTSSLMLCWWRDALASAMVALPHFVKLPSGHCLTKIVGTDIGRLEPDVADAAMAACRFFFFANPTTSTIA